MHVLEHFTDMKQNRTINPVLTNVLPPRAPPSQNRISSLALQLARYIHVHVPSLDGNPSIGSNDFIEIWTCSQIVYNFVGIIWWLKHL